MSNSGEENGGFTLLEVLIAIAILGVSMVVILQSQLLSVSLVDRTLKDTKAVLLAERRMAEIEAGENYVAGEDAGEFEDFPGYSWSTTANKVDAAGEAAGRLLRVSVKVFCPEVPGTGDAEIVTYFYSGE